MCIDSQPLSTLTVCQQPRSRGVLLLSRGPRLLAKSNCLRFVRNLAGTHTHTHTQSLQLELELKKGRWCCGKESVCAETDGEETAMAGWQGRGGKNKGEEERNGYISTVHFPVRCLAVGTGLLSPRERQREGESDASRPRLASRGNFLNPRRWFHQWQAKGGQSRSLPFAREHLESTTAAAAVVPIGS